MIVTYRSAKNCLDAFENLQGWQEVETGEESEVREEAYRWLSSLVSALHEAHLEEIEAAEAVQMKLDEETEKNKDLRKKNTQLRGKLGAIKSAIGPVIADD